MDDKITKKAQGVTIYIISSLQEPPTTLYVNLSTEKLHPSYHL